MRIFLRRAFQYMDGHDGRARAKELPAGYYNVPAQVPEHIARLAIDFGKAVVVKQPMVEKRAPENKVVVPPETKEEPKAKPRKYKKRST